MSYTPTSWATGDIITAEKLNNMEQGIAEVNNVEVIIYNFEVDDGAVDADDDVETVLDNLQHSNCVCVAKISVDGNTYRVLLNYNYQQVFAEFIHIKSVGENLTLKAYKITGTASNGWLFSESSDKTI